MRKIWSAVAIVVIALGLVGLAALRGSSPLTFWINGNALLVVAGCVLGGMLMANPLDDLRHAALPLVIRSFWAFPPDFLI